MRRVRASSTSSCFYVLIYSWLVLVLTVQFFINSVVMLYKLALTLSWLIDYWFTISHAHTALRSLFVTVFCVLFI